MKPRTMYDSTNAADIPHSATIVAAYLDGKYKTWNDVVDRFPTAEKVTITVTGQIHADVIDRETGDVDAAAAARWAREEIVHGHTPTIYCNRSSWPEVKAAIASLMPGAHQEQVRYWIADWTGRPHRIAGATAVQYADPATSGGHYDLSTIYGPWPGRLDRKPLGPIRRRTLRRIERDFKARRHPLTLADLTLVSGIVVAANRAGH